MAGKQGTSVAATHPSLSRNCFSPHRRNFSPDFDDLVEQSRSDSPSQPPPAAVPGVMENPNCFESVLFMICQLFTVCSGCLDLSLY
ncbi:hypothetical protein N7527_009160 [Penicillium freii]|nr:hypothetical protein N7527_009160 [Penicillium freii]